MRKNFRLKAELDALYLRYDRPEFVHEDPLGMASPGLAPEDFELVSFIVAGLSYGRVEQIRASSRALLGLLGPWKVSPSGDGLGRALSTSKFLGDPALEDALAGWRHRFNTPQDAADLLRGLARAKQRYGSLCRLYQSVHHENPAEQVHAFSEKLLEGSPVRPLANSASRPEWEGTGLRWFAASPRDGGTCKRLMMWFRWMIRSDQVDTGIWHKLADPALPLPSAARLYWPVDTHVFRWAKAKGIVRRASPTWKAVEEITEFFRTLEPLDPVKYDFAVCHSGMDRVRVRAPRP